MSASAPNAEPVLIVNDHAKRHQDVKIPLLLIEALKLTPEQVRELYVSDNQSYSNGMELIQLHFKTDTPSAEVQKYRGVVFKYGDPINPRLVSMRAMSFPYADPIIADELPAHFVEQGDKVKYSTSRQGFVARVFCPVNTVCVSTHRKIDCARSKFGASIPMKEMFQQAAELAKFDPAKLFTSAESKLYCHVFFVSHTDMRLLPTEDDAPELMYLGSLRTDAKKLMWADAVEDDEDDDRVASLEVMLPAEPQLPALELLRPRYYSPAEAQALFTNGTPLIAWVAGSAPTRLVPTSRDRKEQIRGNTPNLKLAWYKLLDSGKQDSLRDVIPAAKHHLLDEYWAELLQMLDGKPAVNGKGEPTFKGSPMPAKGSLIEHLLSLLPKLKAEADRATYLAALGKATAPVLRRLESYERNLLGKSDKEKTVTLTRFLRLHLWKDLTCPNVYTLISEFKRAIAPPAERAAMAAAAQ